MAITAAQVKELRDATGAGMMDAKRALQETDGNMEAAVDWLRTKGLAKAAKKAGRTAAEGLVGVAVKDGVGVAVEVNSETDFVSRNSEFQQLVATIAAAATGAASLDALNATVVDGKPAANLMTEAVARIGEHLSLRRMARVEGETVASYVHGATADGMGRIGVLVALKGVDAGIGKQIAMHVAASAPAALDAASLDPALVARERAIFAEQARESGKPEAVIEKMIEGRLRKFYAESTLLGQQFVINPDITVAQAAKDAGVEIVGYVRMAVGEGIEKEAEDYAAEVAKLAQG